MGSPGVDYDRIYQMFECLSEVTGSGSGEVAFCFGRKDPQVAITAWRFLEAGSVGTILFTGGIGKDSGDLQVPEAEYLASVARSLGVEDECLLVEPKATNGGENVRFGLAMIQERDPQLMKLPMVVVAHATSLRRLGALMEHIALTEFGGLPLDLSLEPTIYPFNPLDKRDQQEAVAEILRLADWPAKGWLQPQPDLPVELVEYARQIQPFL